jgi:SNF2 family DNA or RNA helicase
LTKLPKDYNLLVPARAEYQLETILEGIENPTFAILLHMGLGKSYCAINIARYRLQKDDIKKVLVIVPPTLMTNWKNEITKYSEYKSIIIHSSTRKERIKQIQTFLNKSYLNFGIINYEALPLYYDDIKEIPIDMMIFDESARYIKNVEARRTKAAIGLSAEVPYKYILTGTLFSNNPTSVWAQFKVLDGGKTFGPNFYAFRNYFFYKKEFGSFIKWIIKPSMISKMKRRIENTSIIKGREELNLPEPIKNKIIIEPSDEFMKTYMEVSRKVEAEIESLSGNLTLNINNIFTKLLKLQQVCSGIIIDNDGNEHVLKENPKLDALLEYTETVLEEGESVIIFTRFRKSQDIICKKLEEKSIKYISMKGGDKDTYSKWKGFQQSKTINVFVCQIQSGGLGIELMKLDSTAKYQHVVYYEHVDLDYREQSKSRIDRIGQQSICVYLDIVLKGTYDEKILKNFEEGLKISEAIMKKGVKYLFEKEN